MDSSRTDPFDASRTLRRQQLQHGWQHARQAYLAAGAPLGASMRAFEVWLTFGAPTTRN
ncbi:hypothetical protein [Salisaeta longa]|uniref:hypothetical protein n=1 Tax=Salisaeta longa TaxID=503170 RepID=UPI0003B73585|nr:hypothetical protein [Salisaeta longa]